MQRSIIICFCLFGLAVFGQNRSAAPNVRDVVKKFYSQYTMDFLVYPYVAFEKRKEGWYVVTQKVNKGNLEPVDRFLFYDNVLKKYKSLSFAKVMRPKEVKPGDYFDEYTLRNYDLYICYGYRGWYKDVIKDLKDRKQLSDDEMNSLARAYSMYAGALLSDQAADALLSEVWQLPFNMNCLSQKQIDEFNLLEGKAQEYFKKLADRSPDFETVVGKIGMKYANEVMFQFAMLLAHANNYAVKMKLPEDLYSDDQLAPAKRILESCPANAIFLSLGDNDYYPLHYLQHTRRIRRDVYVINYSLISLDRFIYQATQPQHDASAIKLTADTSLYRGNKNDLVYIKDSSYSIDFTDLIGLMKYGEKNEFGATTLKADNILLSEGKTADTSGITFEKKRVVSINGAKYFLKQQWILLDILNNLNDRKICFPNKFDDELRELNDQLEYKNGLFIFSNKK
jgi:hypothetical protein